MESVESVDGLAEEVSRVGIRRDRIRCAPGGYQNLQIQTRMAERGRLWVSVWELENGVKGKPGAVSTKIISIAGSQKCATSPVQEALSFPRLLSVEVEGKLPRRSSRNLPSPGSISPSSPHPQLQSSSMITGRPAQSSLARIPPSPSPAPAQWTQPQPPSRSSVS